MAVLVTGGCGFIGRHIATHLIESGFDVVATTRSREKCVKACLPALVEICEGDLNDHRFLQRLFSKFSVDSIVHAAWDGVLGPERNKKSQFKNIELFGNILEQAASSGCRTVIGIGSQDEYGVHNKRIDESFLPQPASLYGVAKLACAHAGIISSKRHDFNFAWLRLFSCYGPGDDDYYIIPYSIRCFLSQTPPRLTHCTQMWDYLYVKDIPKFIEAVIRAENPFCDIYNMCTGRPMRLRDIILMTKQLTGSTVEPAFGVLEYRDNKLFHLEGDSSKFISTFGALDLTDIKTGLSKTVEWYRALESSK